MRGLLKTAVEYLKKKGAEYGDVRFERVTTESIQVRDGVIEGHSTDSSSGIGIRVVFRGAWGFASTHMTTEKDALKAADQALAVAAACSSVNRTRVALAETALHVDAYATPFRIDPFSVSPEEKTGRLIEVTTEASRYKDIAVCEAFMAFSRVDKEFVSTEGAEITQSLLTSGCGYHVIAENGHDAQTRSYPDSHHGLFSTKGYELIDELDMMGSLERVTGEARALLNAKECAAGTIDVIIDGPQMALQIHESCGHPAELDRALGSEISFAGGSFLTTDRMGAYRYGSGHVNLYADPNHPGGAGSYKYDDEGVRTKRVDIVKEGVFTDYLSSREGALVIGARSNGAMRAEGWNRLPIVRMSNICIEPGEVTLSDLIADTKNGLLLSTNRSWSIDDLRLNFQFGTEIAYEIRNGKLGRIFKNPVYSGITPDFWASCDAVCSKEDWRMWGLNSCAKGEPVQVIGVGHGASPARFRGVSVGVLKTRGER
ncbi:MAG: TldD/PmbA family protein [Deltaproteobacteria bacterium]|nr:TldD/PmbA family protein [Deltaproteobacteria bacterium]